MKILFQKQTRLDFFLFGISFLTTILYSLGTLITLKNCNTKILFVMKISFQNILKYYHNYHYNQENNLQFLLVSIQVQSIWLFYFPVQTLSHRYALLCFLESTQKILLKLFSLFCNTRHFLHSSVSLVKRDCSLHIVKHISTFCHFFSIEAVLEQGIRTFHVLISETKCIQFM